MTTILVVIVVIVIIAIMVIHMTAQYMDTYFHAFDENMIDIRPIDDPTWDRNTCAYELNKTLEKVFSEYNIKHDVGKQPSIILPCTYENINREIDDITPYKDQRIFIIHNADYIAAKDYLWKMLVEYWGIDKAKTLMPNTYITASHIDMSRFKNEYKKGRLYIMKKNIQRQEGLKIVNSLKEIIDSKNSYVVVQELLQDPYIINSRKINMRFYILVVCNEGNVDVYVYDDGFMYYTKEAFKKGSSEFGPNITTGYIERSVYDTNPLTHEDFKKYLDDPVRELNDTEQIIARHHIKISSVLFNRIHDVLRRTFMAITDHICMDNKLRPAITFQLFGADIAISDKLMPLVMEINKGPDLGAKDERDGTVKKRCTVDMLRTLGLIKEKGRNGFVKILER
jgi:hypothetical protein